MLDDDQLQRRSVLRGLVGGSIAASGLPGLAAGVEALGVDDVEPVVESSEVRAIKRADPGLELRPGAARGLGGGDAGATVQSESPSPLGGRAAVSIPANHGTLLVHEAGGQREAVLYFDERISGLDVDWPRQTQARLVASGDEAVFQRTATRGEAARVLAHIGRQDLIRSDGVSVGVAPAVGEYAITSVNEDERLIEEIRARETGGRGFEVSVTGRTTHSTSVGSDGSEQGLSAQACDCNDEAADLLYCVYQAQACLGCFIFGIPAPPVAAACIVFVCVGGTGGILLTFVADLGCTDVDPGCVQDCAQSIW